MKVKNHIPFAVILLVALCCVQSYAGATRNPIYLKAPMVQWDGNQLTGELTNVPVNNLLAELISSKDFDCDVSGQIQGSISIRFDDLTVEEIIQKVMRSGHFNYTLLSAPASTEIEKLTIYQGDSIISFNRVPSRSGTTVRSAIALPAKKTPKSSRATKSDAGYAEGIKKLNGEIKDFLDDMLESKELSKEEYEKALVDINTNVKTN